MKTKFIEVCETCEEDINDCRCVYCKICKKDYDTDYDECRHLFWYSKVGRWYGTGSYESYDEWFYKKMQEAFDKFISDNPQITEDLVWTIENGKMGFEAIHFTGTIFGYDGVHCYLNGNWYGHLFTNDLKNMNDEKYENYSLFVNWLLGLDGDKTEEANKLTVEWIKRAKDGR